MPTLPPGLRRSAVDFAAITAVTADGLRIRDHYHPDVHGASPGVASANHRTLTVHNTNATLRVRIGRHPDDPPLYPGTPDPVVEPTGPLPYVMYGGLVVIAQFGQRKGGGSFNTLMYCPSLDAPYITYPVSP
jgi:hypothetical protein